jgi:hypothetical protein
MVNEHALGRIVDIDESGVATIKATLPNLLHALDRHYDEVEIILPDGRRITPKQRRLCYLLLGGIAEYVDGIRNEETIEDAKRMMKMEFMLNRMNSQERRLFSLSNCGETTATCFITYLIDFIVKNDIPTSFSLLDNCEDIGKYIYACLLNRKCCICGQAADLHHVEGSRIGQGNDRNEVHHLGRECLPLCREHHTICHNDEKAFISRYHLEPVKIDEKICRVFRLKK